MRRLKQKDINFLLPMAKKKEINVKELKKAGIVLLPLLLLGGCVGCWAMLTFSQQDMRRELDDLNLKISMLQGGNAYATAQEFQKANSAKQDYLTNLSMVSAGAKTYPEMGSAFFSALEKCLTDDIQLTNVQYAAENRLLTLYGSARNVGDTADFAERLRNEGRFLSVTYTGWQSTGEMENDVLLAYTFQMNAELLPNMLNEEETALLQPDDAAQTQEGNV